MPNLCQAQNTFCVKSIYFYSLISYRNISIRHPNLVNSATKKSVYKTEETRHLYSYVMTTNTNTTWSYISNWMNANAAAEYIAECIAKGIYQKGQIKKSSPRFANKKDKTNGYECRIIAVSGINADMEIGLVGYRKTGVTKVQIDTSKLHAIKKLLKIENVATDDNGQLKVTDNCVHLKDGSRIQLFIKKAN